jgi:hypothetical protein
MDRWRDRHGHHPKTKAERTEASMLAQWMLVCERGYGCSVFPFSKEFRDKWATDEEKAYYAEFWEE